MGCRSLKPQTFAMFLAVVATAGSLSYGWADSFHSSRFSQVPAGQTGVMRGSVQQSATPTYPVTPCPQGVYPTYGVPYGAYGVPVYPTTTQTLQVPVQGGGTFTYSTTTPGYYGTPYYGSVSPYGGSIYGGSTTRFQGSFSQRRF